MTEKRVERFVKKIDAADSHEEQKVKWSREPSEHNESNFSFSSIPEVSKINSSEIIEAINENQ